MSGIVVVAIPEEDDQVWRLSSEKVPHLTLLYLDEFAPDEIETVWGHIAHSADTMLNKFHLTAERRGVLGDEEADVVFFKSQYTKDLEAFRSQLIAHPMIARAYLSVEQHPKWTPHLTMGYPETPAKKSKWGDDKVWGVGFDRIALWVDDYEGPTIPLKERVYAYNEEVAMSDRVSKHLAHYGIKGMRWGRRKSEGTSAVEVSATPGKKVVAKGGENQPAAPDAVRVAAYKQKAKASTTDALQTKELQELVNRMNLEQQYSRLTQEKGFFDRLDQDKKKVDKLMGAGQTANNMYTFLNSPIGKTLVKVVKSNLKR